jgi:hypothetical protein
MSEQVPAALAAAVRSTMRPVRPLPSPGRRVLWLTPLVALALIAASRVFSFRADAVALGWSLTWGVSLLESSIALILIAVALRDAVPGRTLHASSVFLIIGAAIGLTAMITLGTWSASPTVIERLSPVWVGEVCFIGTIVTALPLLVAAFVFAARAFVVRPWSSGALYGLGAGIGADAGWRLFCHFSDPMHVFPTHIGAIVVVMLLGIAASAAQRSRR